MTSLFPRSHAAALAALTFALAPAAQATPQSRPPLLDEVVVTGTRNERLLSEAPVATEVISRSEIDASGALNAAELLAGRAGIEVVTALNGEGVRLQGLNPEHVLILVDGKRVTGRVNGGIDLSRFPIETLERIEIVRGATSALYGSEAMGGVINLITRPALAPLSVETQAAYGGLNTALLSGSVTSTLAGIKNRTTAAWRKRDSFALTPGSIDTDGNAFNQLTLSNSSEAALSETLLLKAHVDYLFRDQTGIDVSTTGAVFDRLNRNETFSVSLDPEVKLPAFPKLRFNAYYNLYRDQFVQDQRNSSALDQRQETLDQLAQITLQDERILSEAHVLTSGAEIAYEHIQTERLLNAMADRVRGAVYLQDEWMALENPGLMLVPGLRYDVDSRYGSNLAPKVSAKLDPTSNLTFRMSVGGGFRAPDFKELMMAFQNPSVGYEVVGNPNLRPETSQSLNAGFDFRATSWSTLSLNLLHNRVKDLIQTELVPNGDPGSVTQYRYVNIAAARTQGVEATVQFQPLAGLVLEPGYMLNDTWDETLNRPLPGRALHRLTLTSRYRHEGTGLSGYARASYSSERPFYTNPNGQPVDSPYMAPGYTMLEMRITKAVTEKVSVYVQGDNLLNVLDPLYLPLQPLTVLAGVTARF